MINVAGFVGPNPTLTLVANSVRTPRTERC
jgi:hypothetical protein